MAVSCRPVSSPSRLLPRSGRLLSTITEPTSAAPCDPPLVEETSSSPPVSEESEVDRADHGGIKKVCFKVSEDEQEDSGHDTMSYRDSYRCVLATGHQTAEASDLWESQNGHFPTCRGIGLWGERCVFGGVEVEGQGI